MPPQPTSSGRRWLCGAAAASALVLAGTTALPAEGAAPVDVRTASRVLRHAVTPEGVSQHLRALDAIAAQNGGTRASGTPGYTASVRYLLRRLRAAGYKPQVQGFTFPFFSEDAPSTLERVSPDAAAYTDPDDFTTMTYSGSGDVTGSVVAVDTALSATDDSTSGCEAADFDGFPAGAVALMQRGTCTFEVKVANAAAAGAAAALIFNRGTEGNTDSIAGTLGNPATIPALGLSFAAGQDLGAPATQVHLTTTTTSENRRTFNVTADTRGGNVNRVVMTGAHLDSVVPGPGINDNGSGAATILEVAEQLAAKNFEPRHRIRFAWWGAEELGLLGATHYVANLREKDPAALDDIALYLNFDMVGSPNYARFIYDGDNSAFGEEDGAAVAPEGSGKIEADLRRYFTSQHLATSETPFDGRSDYGPFIDEGIPSGGLFTGAEGIKTPAEAETYGGTAGEPYDACYHAACDTFANVNQQAIDEMSDGVAHIIAVYGYRVGLPGLGNRPARVAARHSSRTALPVHGQGVRR